MTDLMCKPTDDKPLEKWQKWANLSRIEAVRAEKAEAQRDELLVALKEIVPVCGGALDLFRSNHPGDFSEDDAILERASALVEGE